MAEIILRLPSKAITYGYVELRGTPEEFGTCLDSPNSIGMMYSTYVGAYLAGEQEGLELFQRGATEAPPGDPQAAADRLAEGKPPRTVDELREMSVQLIKKELGATEVGEEPAPWKQEAAAKPKPWETSAKAPAETDDSDW